MSNNQEHLKWIYDRLIFVHNENPHVDYMVRFRGIIDDTGAAEFQPTQITVPKATLERSLIALEAGLEAATGEHNVVAKRVEHAADLLQRQHPQAPADGEVAELVEWLGNPIIVGGALAASDSASRWLTRAASLLQRQHPQPVPVSERMPEPSVKVLAHYFNALGKGRTICAIWVPAKSRSDEGDLDADDFLEYDEENDKYHWPEGWYEAIENWEELGWAKVYEGEIAYWQPLPQWPANALPTPASEVKL